MFKRARREVSSCSIPADSLHGFIYCAARSVHELAPVLATFKDADHLLRALANLEQLAKCAQSPAHDQAEIVSWRKAAESHAGELRQFILQDAPDDMLSIGPIQLDPSVLSSPILRRASA